MNHDEWGPWKMRHVVHKDGWDEWVVRRTLINGFGMEQIIPKFGRLQAFFAMLRARIITAKEKRKARERA